MVKTSTMLAVLAAFAVPSNLFAESKELRKGPPCEVEKSVNDHLVQIYVTPPKAGGEYAPGQLQIFLRREYPDYLYVPLESSELKDGRLHVQIALSPEKLATYSLTVLDRQPAEHLMLYWKNLSDIKSAEQPNK